MYVSNHVGSLSSTAVAAACATTAARGFSTFAWSLTDLRSFCATPRPLLSAQRTLFIVAGRALGNCTAQEGALNCSAQTSLARPLRCSRRSEDDTQAAATARPGDARCGLPFEQLQSQNR